MLNGSCLCGAVGFEVEGEVTPIGHCHCSKCRKVSGAASGAVFHAKTTDASLRFTRGEDQVRTFRLPDGWSSVFCQQCGCPMPHRSSDGSRWFVPAGAIDGDPGVRSMVHIFVDSKAAWDEIHGPQAQFREGLGSERIG